MFSSAIHLSPVADPHHQDKKPIILDTGDKAVVSHAILPELAQARASKGLPEASRIIQLGQALMQKGQDTPCDRRIELIEVPLGGGIKLNPPGHIA